MAEIDLQAHPDDYDWDEFLVAFRKEFKSVYGVAASDHFPKEALIGYAEQGSGAKTVGGLIESTLEECDRRLAARADGKPVADDPIGMAPIKGRREAAAKRRRAQSEAAREQREALTDGLNRDRKAKVKQAREDMRAKAKAAIGKAKASK